VTSLVVDEVTVDLFGTTAVVRGRTVATGTDKGLAIDVQLRFTDVFLKRDGAWQAVASHASLIAE
jgi:ketosteroid isomerase-like protein